MSSKQGKRSGGGAGVVSEWSERKTEARCPRTDLTDGLTLNSGTRGGCWSVARFARSGVVPGYRDFGDPNKDLSLYRGEGDDR